MFHRSRWANRSTAVPSGRSSSRATVNSIQATPLFPASVGGGILLHRRKMYARSAVKFSRSLFIWGPGMTGMTAWAGLHLVEVKLGRRFSFRQLGAVGNVAGQLGNFADAVSSGRLVKGRRSSFCGRNAALISLSITRLARLSNS